MCGTLCATCPAAVITPKSFARKTLTARLWCCWKRNISCQPWTWNWDLRSKFAQRSTHSRPRTSRPLPTQPPRLHKIWTHFHVGHTFPLRLLLSHQSLREHVRLCNVYASVFPVLFLTRKRRRKKKRQRNRWILTELERRNINRWLCSYMYLCITVSRRKGKEGPCVCERIIFYILQIKRNLDHDLLLLLLTMMLFTNYVLIFM